MQLNRQIKPASWFISAGRQASTVYHGCLKIALGLLFSQNDQQTRSNFISQASTVLNRIQAGSGIEDFRVIMDNTNNSEADVENNRLNGKIIVVPTRAVEFIAMDFIITNSGVEFPS